MVHHMYSTLLPDMLSSTHLSGSTGSDQLKMVVAIHKVVPSQVSYDALASSLLMMLVHGKHQENEESIRAIKPVEQHRMMRKMRAIIRALSKDLKPNFDGYSLMYSLFSHGVSDENWTLRNEEDKARLMFQCATLSAAALVNPRGADTLENCSSESIEREEELRQFLVKTKSLLLTWCCTDYGPKCNKKVKRKHLQYGPNTVEAPDFSSALGPMSQAESIPSWLNNMRCLLYLEEADSPLMKAFISPDSSPADEADWDEEAARIRLCCQFGGAVNDDMIWKVIKSCSQDNGGIDPDMAVRLLENLFECCGKGRSGQLEVSDPSAIWELYNLIALQFSAPERNGGNRLPSDDEMEGENGLNSPKDFSIPRYVLPRTQRGRFSALVTSNSSPVIRFATGSHLLAYGGALPCLLLSCVGHLPLQSALQFGRSTLRFAL